MPKKFQKHQNPLETRFVSKFTSQERPLWDVTRQDFLAKEVDEAAAIRHKRCVSILGEYGMKLLMEPFEKGVEGIETDRGFPARSLRAVIQTLLRILLEKFDA